MVEPLTVAYLTLSYTSIALLLYLVFYCYYRRINGTLLVFCIFAILNTTNETILIVHQLSLGYQTVESTYGEPICIISAIFEHLIPLVLTFLASCIGFHIWLVVIGKSKKTEYQMLKWYCLVSIGIPVFTTALACILQRDQPYLTSRPRKFYCEMADTPVTAGTFALPLLLASVPGMVFSLWTAVVLLQHIRSFRQLLSPPRMSGLHIGHSLRLVVFTIVFAVIIIMTAMERVIYIFSEGPSGEDGEQVSAMSDFSGSVVGVGIFVVFGTTSASLRTIWRLICCKGLRGFDDNSSNGSGGSSSRRSGSTPSRRVSDNNSQDALDDFYAMDGVESDTLDIFDMLRSSPITRPAPVHSPV